MRMYINSTARPNQCTRTMLCNSISIAYPKSYSFPSYCNSDSHHNFYFSRKPVTTVRFSKTKCKIFSKQFFTDKASDDLAVQNWNGKFTRFERSDYGELQTAIVSYRKKFPWSILQPFLQVDLVSTVHIADKEYFSFLQKKLEHYDCVLFEMVCSREALESIRNPAAEKNARKFFFELNIAGFIQRMFAKMLRLDTQLDCLEYGAENWYHADLFVETFDSLLHERGESIFRNSRDTEVNEEEIEEEVNIWTELLMPKDLLRSFIPKHLEENLHKKLMPKDLSPWRSELLSAFRVLPMPLLGDIIIKRLCTDAESQAAEYRELQAFSKLDFNAAMKAFLGKLLASDFVEDFEDEEAESVIVGERNKVAVETLEKAIRDGQKKIAILYGGGHMPDMARRLEEELHLVPSRVCWITAWSITNKNTTSTFFPLLKMIPQALGWQMNGLQALVFLLVGSVVGLVVGPVFALVFWCWVLACHVFDVMVNEFPLVAWGFYESVIQQLM